MRPTLLLVHIFHSSEVGLWTEISVSVVTVWHHERKYWSRNNCLAYTVFDIISAHALISAHPVLFEKNKLVLISAHGFWWKFTQILVYVTAQSSFSTLDFCQSNRPTVFTLIINRRVIS